jgi:alpha-mannosidase
LKRFSHDQPVQPDPATAPHPALNSRLDLQPLWQRQPPCPDGTSALLDSWGRQQRPDWAARGLIIWPRGGQEIRLQLRLERPRAWEEALGLRALARLCLRWWAEAAELRVAGAAVHRGDLFDTACRWVLPATWWQGQPLDVELLLISPRHDDGALIHSRLELEPLDPADPDGLLNGQVAELEALRRSRGLAAGPGPGPVQLLGHAHLDLAWLWPVADTWRAAERTFTSVLALMERFPQLHFGHSTPALYAWLEQHRPALFQRIRAAMRAGRWEPLNGPWVESDCLLIDTASLLRQFQLGQSYSRRAFPEWHHDLAWLPDSFGFACGLPAVAQATGVRWFCTHKLAWNATNPFPHRLFRWRSRCGSELLALMTAPIGTDGDPLAIETHRLAWQRQSGVEESLWLPGVGDHGGGPTAEMLEQLELWQQQPAMARLQHGSLRDHLARLLPLAPRLPVWRDELYLELHRGCATSRPDQKRHNRSLERLLREAELAHALLAASAPAAASQTDGAPTPGHGGPESCDWRPLLFQQFHDILPGTSIPEVFEQAEPQWRAARRQAARQRDRDLRRLFRLALPRAPGDGCRREASPHDLDAHQLWWVAQLLPLPAAPRCCRLPAGSWRLRGAHGQAGPLLPVQSAPGGGVWVQLPLEAGLTAQTLERRTGEAPPQAHGGVPSASVRTERPAAAGGAAVHGPAVPLQHPVDLQDLGQGRWRLSNGLISARCSSDGIEQLEDADGRALLAAPLRWCRWRDRGEFWDAWDIASDYRDQPLPWSWEAGPEPLGRGPICTELRWRGRCGSSPLQLTARLLAGCPWLELVLSLHWRQRHELLQLEIPLASATPRWAADTSAGVIERPGHPRTARERSRWEAAAISWVAAADLAVLLDGPQGVSAEGARLSVSLLRAPTWPDPGADNGFQRQRLALMAAPGGWRAAAVPQQARRLREPLWLRPIASPWGEQGAAGDQGAAPAAAAADPPGADSGRDGSSSQQPSPCGAPPLRTGSAAQRERAARLPAAEPPSMQAAASPGLAQPPGPSLGSLDRPAGPGAGPAPRGPAPGPRSGRWGQRADPQPAERGALPPLVAAAARLAGAGAAGWPRPATAAGTAGSAAPRSLAAGVLAAELPLGACRTTGALPAWWSQARRCEACLCRCPVSRRDDSNNMPWPGRAAMGRGRRRQPTQQAAGGHPFSPRDRRRDR